MGGRLKTENTYLYIIIVYRYHGNDAEFSDHFMEIIDDYKDKPLVILGDFNIDLLSYNTNHNTDKLINIKSINYTPSIISFCETNLKSDDPEDYSISSYNSEHLFAIPDKNKGSGISLCYKKRIYLTEYHPSTYVITILNVWGVALKLKTLTYT